MIYLAGRVFQLIGLLAMPSALWLGQFAHDERGAIAVFSGSLLVFWIGYLLTKISKQGTGM